MAEFALLGYNGSLPEIDKGDDIYVVNEISGELWRVQVKGATVQQSGGSRYQVIVLERQIRIAPSDIAPDLHFVFALRQGKRWRFIVVSRAGLKERIDKSQAQNKKLGSLNKSSGRRSLSFTFLKENPDKVSKRWTDCLDMWDEWPYTDHEKAAAEHKDYSSDTSKSESVSSEIQSNALR